MKQLLASLTILLASQLVYSASFEGHWKLVKYMDKYAEAGTAASTSEEMGVVNKLTIADSKILVTLSFGDNPPMTTKALEYYIDDGQVFLTNWKEPLLWGKIESLDENIMVIYTDEEHLGLGAGWNYYETDVEASTKGTSPTPGGMINNVIDCYQYPTAEGDSYLLQGELDCRDWAESRGYHDGTLLPMDTAQEKVNLASEPLTCPAVNAGNTGYYCIGLGKK